MTNQPISKVSGWLGPDLSAAIAKPLNHKLALWLRHRLATFFSKPRNRKFAILGVVLAVLFLGRMELTISGEFSAFPTHNADVRSAVDGLIAEVYVREGDFLEAGDPVARLVDRDYRARKLQVEATLARSRANLKLLLAGTRVEEIDLARQEISTAETRLAQSSHLTREATRLRDERITKAISLIELATDQLEFAQGELGRYQALRDKNIVTVQKFTEINQAAKVKEFELAEAEADLANLRADNLAAPAREMALARGGLREATARLDVLLAGTRPEQLEAAEAEVSEHMSQLVLVNEQLALTIITTPEAGVVVTPRVHESQGRMVRQGDLIAEVYDYSTILAEILVPEKEFGDVTIGQEVVLKARAYPGETFVGIVTAIAPRAVSSEDGLGRQMIRVTTEIDNPGLLLKPDMTGNGKIYAGKRTIFTLISRRLVRYLRVEFWSWW